MIVRHLSDYNEPLVTISVRAPGGEWREVEALVDTSFTEQVTLPSGLVSELGLLPTGAIDVQLADGSTHTCSTYGAHLLWDKRVFLVDTHEEDTEPLIGMRMLQGYNLSIDVEPVGQVRIERLNRSNA